MLQLRVMNSNFIRLFFTFNVLNFVPLLVFAANTLQNPIEEFYFVGEQKKITFGTVEKTSAYPIIVSRIINNKTNVLRATSFSLSSTQDWEIHCTPTKDVNKKICTGDPSTIDAQLLLTQDGGDKYSTAIKFKIKGTTDYVLAKETFSSRGLKSTYTHFEPNSTNPALQLQAELRPVSKKMYEKIYSSFNLASKYNLTVTPFLTRTSYLGTGNDEATTSADQKLYVLDFTYTFPDKFFSIRKIAEDGNEDFIDNTEIKVPMRFRARRDKEGKEPTEGTYHINAKGIKKWIVQGKTQKSQDFLENGSVDLEKISILTDYSDSVTHKPMGETHLTAKKIPDVQFLRYFSNFRLNPVFSSVDNSLKYYFVAVDANGEKGKRIERLALYPKTKEILWSVQTVNSREVTLLAKQKDKSNIFDWVSFVKKGYGSITFNKDFNWDKPDFTGINTFVFFEPSTNSPTTIEESERVIELSYESPFLKETIYTMVNGKKQNAITLTLQATTEAEYNSFAKDIITKNQGI